MRSVQKGRWQGARRVVWRCHMQGAQRGQRPFWTEPGGSGPFGRIAALRIWVKTSSLDPNSRLALHPKRDSLALTPIYEMGSSFAASLPLTSLPLTSPTIPRPQAPLPWYSIRLLRRLHEAGAIDIVILCTVLQRRPGQAIVEQGTLLGIHRHVAQGRSHDLLVALADILQRHFQLPHSLSVLMKRYISTVQKTR